LPCNTFIVVTKLELGHAGVGT